MSRQGSIQLAVNPISGLLLVVGILLCSTRVAAHNANLSTFHIIQNDQGWTLEAHVARHTLDYGFAQAHPDDKNVSALSIEQWFVSALKTSITIRGSWAQEAKLDLVQVSMGGHQCVALFKLSDIVQSPEQLTVNIDSFSDNPDHTNIVRVFQQSEKFDGKLRKKKKALSQRNDYQHIFVLAER